MDIAETMKNIVAKGIQTEMGPPSFIHTGYITEKLYMLLQLYLQNKGLNPSVELLQCFAELKEAAMLPSAAYLQMMANRITLDGQSRLILRDTGKIILPYEHFSNAVLLKHVNGPHGLHLGVEATIRAVSDSYTIGRDCFGMEKDFIASIVQSCLNPACRYYKSQMELSQKSLHMSAPTYISESTGSDSLPPNPESTNMLRGGPYSSMGPSPDFSMPMSHQIHHHQGGNSDLSGLTLEKPVNVIRNDKISRPHSSETPVHKLPMQKSTQQQHYESSQIVDHKFVDFLRSNIENLEGLPSTNKDLLALHNGAWSNNEPEKRMTNAQEVGQEKIVRAFAEIMKNMSRMKTCVRPAMCKPYGKQSESLQKTLVDTIQLVQSLRSCLPPPHIAVSSWKNEDKHRKNGLEEMIDGGRKLDE